MGKTIHIIKNNNGSVIVIVMLILVVLTLAGMFAISTSTTEVQIAINDLRHKMAFYAADGATELGQELIEQNINCPSGFIPDDPGEPEATIGSIVVTKHDFWITEDEENGVVPIASDENRDAYLPADYGSGPHANIKFSYKTIRGKGGAMQMAAGYEGVAKSAMGSAYFLYTVSAQGVGQFNDKALIQVKYRHMIREDGECKH